jgi:fibro-slime domain-containing protein
MKTDWIKKIVVCVLCVALAGSNIQMMNIQAGGLTNKQAAETTKKVKSAETKQTAKGTEPTKTVQSTESTEQIQNIDNAKGAQVDSAALTSAGPILGAASPTSIANTVNTVDTKDLIKINLFNYIGQNNQNASTSGTISRNGGLQFYYNSYQNTGDYNGYTGGNNIHTGIVQPKLGSDGFPALAVGNQASIGYLFNTNTNVEGKDTLSLGLNHLFTKDADGYYEYNSDINRAVLYNNSADFTLKDWSSNGAIKNSDINKSFSTGFYPYATNNTNVNKYMASYGMNIGFDFLQPQGGQINNQDMDFTFSGDDDVWVYIDDALALDLGGIHQAAGGEINFKTGVITEPRSTASAATTTTLYQTLKNAGYTENQLQSTLQITKVNGKVTTSPFNDYTKHHLEFFYLERGGDASNCHIKFNLPAIPSKSLTVTKQVTTLSSSTWIDPNQQYSFQLFTGDSSTTCQATGNKNYKIFSNATDTGVTGQTDKDGKFTLKNGQSAIFSDIPATTYYLVREADPGSDFTVYVNENQANSQKDTQGNKFFESNVVRIADQGQVLFRNTYNNVNFNTQANKTVQLKDWEARTYGITLGVSQLTKTGESIQVDVKDYIDSRFDVDTNSVTQAGGIVGSDGNGTFVIFNNVIISYVPQGSATWSKSFVVKAKDSFIGGNDITTNGPNSTVTIHGGNTLGLAQPVVNVKVRFDANDGQDTIFKGTTLATNYDASKNGVDLQNKLFDSNHVTYQSSTFNNAWLGNGAFTNTWYKQVDATTPGAVKLKVNGIDCYGVAVKLNDVLQTGTETVYYLKTIFNPTTSSATALTNSTINGVSYSVTADNANAVSTYTVHVVDGELTITKNFDQEYLSNMPFSTDQKNLVDAKQSVVVTIAKYAPSDIACTGNVLETYHAVITYDTKNGSYTGTAKVKGLGTGNYKVSEDTKWSWKYVLKSTTDTCDNTADGIVYIGKKVPGGFFGQTGLTSTDNNYAAVTFTNKLNYMKKWFSDTCNVINRFVNRTL